MWLRYCLTATAAPHTRRRYIVIFYLTLTHTHTHPTHNTHPCAEMLSVLTRVADAFRGRSPHWTIVINHFAILEKVMSLCGIISDAHETLYDVLESQGHKVPSSFFSPVFRCWLISWWCSRGITSGSCSCKRRVCLTRRMTKWIHIWKYKYIQHNIVWWPLSCSLSSLQGPLKDVLQNVLMTNLSAKFTTQQTTGSRYGLDIWSYLMIFGDI